MSSLLEKVFQTRPLEPSHPFSHKGKAIPLQIMWEALSSTVSPTMVKVSVTDRVTMTPYRDTLTRHIRSHKEETDLHRAQSSINTENVQCLDPVSPFPVPTPPVGTTHPTPATTSSQIAQSGHPGILQASAKVQQYERADRSDEDASFILTPIFLDPNLEPGSALLSRPEEPDLLFTEDDPTFTDSVFGDGTTNWLLEDNFFDVIDNRTIHQNFAETELLNQGLENGTFGDHTSIKSRTNPSLLDLRRVWYTQIRSIEVEQEMNAEQDRTISVENSSSGDIDERYRTRMANKLIPTLRDDPLPSTDIMVTTSQSYSFSSG